MITQKSRGLLEVSEFLSDFEPFSEFRPPRFVVFSAESVALTDSINNDAIEIAVESAIRTGCNFCRPCPMVPRHGFVESKIVRSIHEVREIARQILSAGESQGEIILQTLVSDGGEENRRFSAVITPRSITIGVGYDGVTDGSKIIASAPLEMSGEHYYEIAIGKRPHVVQKRQGPPVSPGDFVPPERAGHQIKHVIEIKEPPSLLEWEKEVRSISERWDGQVVWYPNSWSGSHYAVHCVMAKVPIFFGESPKIGDTLQKSEEEGPGDNNPHGPRLAKAGFDMYIEEIKSRSIERDLALGIFGAHNGLQLIKSKLGAYFFGAAMAALCCASYKICSAEMRYSLRSKGRWGRDAYYSRHQSKRMICGMLAKMASMFVSRTFPSVGYGGERWGEIAAYSHLTARLTRAGMLQEAVTAANRIVNAQHNNGWAFNKVFHGKRYLNDMASGEIEKSFYALLPVLSRESIEKYLCAGTHPARLGRKPKIFKTEKLKVIKTSIIWGVRVDGERLKLQILPLGTKDWVVGGVAAQEIYHDPGAVSRFFVKGGPSPVVALISGSSEEDISIEIPASAIPIKTEIIGNFNSVFGTDKVYTARRTELGLRLENDPYQSYVDALMGKENADGH